MFSKLIAKLKKSDTNTRTAAETAALASIDTPEKARGLVSYLEAEKNAARKHSPRYNLLCKQHEQAEIAAHCHEIEAERNRVAQVIQRDQATAQKALTDANALHAGALASLKAAQQKTSAIAARLQPLENELQAKQLSAEASAAAAQIEFNAAIAKGDQAAETMAAEALYQAQQACKNGPALEGPLGLRVEALRREMAAIELAVGAAEKEIKEAHQAQLDAHAAIALIEYDRQTQALLDAFFIQKTAVWNAMAQRPTHAHQVTKVALGLNPVEMFEPQVSSTERIIFGSRIDVYNQRHLPSYVTDWAWLSLKAPPDLAVLATNAQDVSDKFPGEEEEVTPAATDSEVSELAT